MHLWKRPLLLSGIGEALSIQQITPILAPPATAAGTPPQWFAVQTWPNFEKRIAEHFHTRAIDYYLPLYHTVHRWKNRCKVPLNLPLFPGYIFAHIARLERVRVLEIPKVIGIVSAGREPVALPDFEIETMRAGLHLRPAEPYPFLNVGERARIKCGPMEGLEGIVVRKKNSLRVVLTLAAIMKSIALEIDACDLEALPHRHATSVC